MNKKEVLDLLVKGSPINRRILSELLICHECYTELDKSEENDYEYYCPNCGTVEISQSCKTKKLTEFLSEFKKLDNNQKMTISRNELYHYLQYLFLKGNYIDSALKFLDDNIIMHLGQWFDCIDIDKDKQIRMSTTAPKEEERKSFQLPNEDEFLISKSFTQLKIYHKNDEFRITFKERII